MHFGRLEMMHQRPSCSVSMARCAVADPSDGARQVHRDKWDGSRRSVRMATSLRK